MGTKRGPMRQLGNTESRGEHKSVEQKPCHTEVPSSWISSAFVVEAAGCGYCRPSSTKGHAHKTNAPHCYDIHTKAEAGQCAWSPIEKSQCQACEAGATRSQCETSWKWKACLRWIQFQVHAENLYCYSSGHAKWL